MMRAWVVGVMMVGFMGCASTKPLVCEMAMRPVWRPWDCARVAMIDADAVPPLLVTNEYPYWNETLIPELEPEEYPTWK